jgi:hypothetical protein
MAVTAEFGVINERYIQLITRVSLTTGVQTQLIPASSGKPGTGPGHVSPDKYFPVPTGQAIRLVHVVANLQDPGGTDQLTAWEMGMFAWAGNGFNIMAHQIPIVNAPLGSIWGYMNSDELILYSDYPELGGVSPNVHVGFDAEVLNNDNVAHNVQYRLDMLVEYYLLKPLGHIGFP